MSREICDLCERESAVGFTVPDEIWTQVLTVVDKSVSILCLSCFTFRADGLRLPWDDDIKFWPVSYLTLERHAGKSHKGPKKL